jgi:hypothetical protein
MVDTCPRAAAYRYLTDVRRFSLISARPIAARELLPTCTGLVITLHMWMVTTVVSSCDHVEALRGIVVVVLRSDLVRETESRAPTTSWRCVGSSIPIFSKPKYAILLGSGRGGREEGE